MVIENVRQFRGTTRTIAARSERTAVRQHTYDYREGGCRAVKNVEVTANLGWANPLTGSAMVMRRSF